LRACELDPPASAFHWGIGFRVLALQNSGGCALLEKGEGFSVFSTGNGDKAFCVDLPVFSESEMAAAGQAKHFIIRELAGEAREGRTIGREEQLAVARLKASRAISAIDGTIPPGRREKLASVVSADTAGFGALEFLMRGAGELEEIEINHPFREIVVFHRRAGRCVSNLALNGQRAFRRMVNSIVGPLGCSLDSAHPFVDAQLPDGSRLHAQIHPLALSGASATIRVASKAPWTVARLVSSGAISPEAAAYLWLCVESGRFSVVVSGPPASGKTSLVSALLSFIPSRERVISVEEEISELRFPDGRIDWIPLRGVPDERKADAERSGRASLSSRTVLDQVVNALRMRPERIVLGELRGAEARRLFSGANLGVPFIATMHSNERGREAARRLHAPPMCVPASSLSQLEIVVCTEFGPDGSRRVAEISELHWESGSGCDAAAHGCERFSIGGCEVRGLRAFSSGERFSSSPIGKPGASKVLNRFASRSGVQYCEALAELKERAAVLRAISEEGNPGPEECFRQIEARRASFAARKGARRAKEGVK
jgi:flagellar protein FlaI